MKDLDLGAAFRSLRVRRAWRQVDLARAAGVSHGTVSLLERGRFHLFTLATIRQVANALGLRIDLCSPWHGQELDRLRDQDHASLQDSWKRELERDGWLVRAELSYSEFGERGRIDLLAYHPVMRVLLVVEVKTSLNDLQETLGHLDVKERLASRVARRLGWNAVSVVPCLVVQEGTTQRRRVVEHAALFSRFSLHGRAALTWLRHPAGRTDGLLMFRELPPANRISAKRRGVKRVRLSTTLPRSAKATPRAAPSALTS